jgi:putative protease
MTRLELLAPAKNLECGLAAIDHGADAVYIGAPRFGARAAVGNSVEDIRQLCQYAHQFEARVYVTVNTLIYDEELSATQQLLQQLCEAGVDAVLVQDMGLLSLSSNLTLHASTQTDNRTPEKVRWLRSLGFSRVVLARELSVQEIAAIHHEVPDVELEVFVHGALCVSYSGICYASQHCFGRSANRGACAQFCRMKFDLLDAEDRELEHQRHLLSLKDLNQSDHLDELIFAGATSFKIEGRLKDVVYVKNVVAAYSQRLNTFIAKHPHDYQRSSKGQCTYSFTPNLSKTFNRGFTTYFLHGRKPDIFSPDTPKALGEFVGTVKELRRDSFNVAGTATFANGDGLCYIDDSRELQGFRVNRAEGNRLYPQQIPRSLRPGMALYRNNDQEFERQLSRSTSQRKIAVSLSLQPTKDGFTLSGDDVSVSIVCEHQMAEKSQRDNIKRQLSRLGGTIYECGEVVLPDDFNYFIPSSLLANLRRSWVDAMMQKMQSANLLSHVISEHSGPSVTTDPNISNQLACQFYGVSKPTAYELRPDDRPLMQCRHCLRFSLGYCVKHGGVKPTWREPLYLRLGDGRRFRLEFNCQQCQMNVYATD